MIYDDDESDLTAEQLAAMWLEAEPVEIARPHCLAVRVLLWPWRAMGRFVDDDTAWRQEYADENNGEDPMWW